MIRLESKPKLPVGFPPGACDLELHPRPPLLRGCPREVAVSLAPRTVARAEDSIALDLLT
jgi:hypothetical protein